MPELAPVMTTTLPSTLFMVVTSRVLLPVGLIPFSQLGDGMYNARIASLHASDA